MTLPVIADQTTPAFRAALNAAFATTYADLAKLLHGQCRLVYVDSTHIRLDRYNGRYLIINGVAEEIPSAGVTFASTGLTASTKYYIYAYMSTGTMTLEASATGHSVDSTTGVRIKTGDSTRTLVGMVHLYGTSFQNEFYSRLVASYFNRRQVNSSMKINNPETTTSTVGEILTTPYANFLMWDDGCDVPISLCGYGCNSTTEQSKVTLIVDGDSTDYSYGSMVFGTQAFQGFNCYGIIPSTYGTEGKHTLQVYANVSGASNGTFYLRIDAIPTI